MAHRTDKPLDLLERSNQIAAAEGITDGEATQMLMTLGTMAMATALPDELRQDLIDGCGRWFARSKTGESLEPGRVRCWQFLEAKNGNSTDVRDREDLAVRGLICVLYDQADEHAGDVLEYFQGLVTRFGVPDTTFGP